jgi:cell division septum initiation protein DivIVA
VLAELVRFLTVNSGVKVTEQLENRVEALETQLSESQKACKAADKAAQTASNKADEAQKVTNLLIKRVAKLE